MGWSILKTTLPKPLSDHTASLGKDDGKVYIAGGCGKFLARKEIATLVAVFGA